MKSRQSGFEITVVLLMLCFCSADSFGYIDPSSGYVLWQMLFGAMVGLLFFAKKIANGFKRLLVKEKSPDSTHP